MKNKMTNLMFIFMSMLVLSACGSGNSKVDQVILEQIKDAETKDEMTNENDINEEPKEQIIYDDFSMLDETYDDILNEIDDVSIEDEIPSADGIDIDLTRLSSTMVYSEVYNMMTIPEDYIGKTVKMNGAFSVYEDEQSGQLYFACIIQDATACCAQGIEFELEGEHSYPEDYPQIGENVTVTGVFETYRENEYLYCRLKNAVEECQ